jgi:hypothetical protein
MNLTFKKNENPKSEKSPQYFVEGDGFKGIAWDYQDEYQGVTRKGFSIKVTKEEATAPVQPAVLPSVQFDAVYDKATAEAPNPNNIPF